MKFVTDFHVFSKISCIVLMNIVHACRSTQKTTANALRLMHRQKHIDEVVLQKHKEIFIHYVDTQEHDFYKE